MFVHSMRTGYLVKFETDNWMKTRLSCPHKVMMDQILIISLWNPTDEQPSKGLFIHEQVKAICQIRSDIIFLEINILPSKKTIFSRTVSEHVYDGNKKLTITIHSVLWKLIYVNYWLIYFLAHKTLRKNDPTFKPSLVHSNIIFPCALVGHLLAKKFNSSHIISEHWSNAENLLKHPIFGEKALNAYRNSDAILCVSTFLANKIRSVTRHPNIVIIPNIIDTEQFQYIPKQFDRKKIHFSCCAIWKKPKRLDLIVKSLIGFATEHNDNSYVLNVIGEGIQIKEFATCAIPENLTINWLGFITKPEIVKVLGTTDFFLHASEIETFSIVTAEALSTGTPVLASNTGALPELINKSNGLLVENTINAWITGLQDITQNTFSNQTIAQEVSNKYSPESVANSIDMVYQKVMEGH
jgi:glycosyltransferase involved in cell wall biosynthesis